MGEGGASAMSDINSSGKPPAHGVMNVCEYLVLHSVPFLRGSQGNAIRLISERIEELGVSKRYDTSTMRKYAKMYRIAARILDGSASKDDLRWFGKSMTKAAREQVFIKKALANILPHSP